MNKTMKICNLALGIALYVALSATVKIPIIGHIQTDLGYIAFGAYLLMFGWQATIVGVAGCLIESLLFSGWFPVGWMVGQTCIGLICGIWYRYSSGKTNKYKNVTRIIVTVLAVFLGIALVKTFIECCLYSIPIKIKFMKDFIAFISDTIPMLFGVFIGEKLKKTVLKED